MRRVAGAVVTVLLLAGCGGESSSEKAAEARLVKFANSLCGLGRAEPEPAYRNQLFAELRALVRADSKLPRVARLLADIHANQKLRAEIDSHTFTFSKAKMDPLEHAYRLDLRIYADEKALGLRCVKPPRKPISG